jgi:hypothetical protein
MTTLYERLTERIDAKDISSHYSDLYVRYTPEAKQIIDEYKRENDLRGWGLCSFFTNHIEGGTWIDVPFAFDPYWTNKGF